MVSAAPVHAQTAGDTQDEVAQIDKMHRETVRLQNEGKNVEAERLAREALERSERAFGEDDPVTATSLNNLAESYTRLARFDEAEPLHRRALAIRERWLAEDHPLLALSLSNLANVLSNLNRLAEAEKLQRRALAIRELTLPEDHLDIAFNLNNLAEVLRLSGRLDEAEQLHRRALAIREKALPEDDPSIALSLSNLALVVLVLNRFDEAEMLNRRALAIRERALPGDHPDLAISLNNLAEVLRQVNRMEEAEQLYRKALAILEKVLQPDHPTISKAQANLGEVLRKLNRLDEAEEMHQRALAARERSLPANHPDIAVSLSSIALVFSDLNRLDEAEQYFRRALAIWEQGPESRDLGLGVNNLAELYRRTGRFVEAVQLQRRAISIWEQVLPEDDPLVALSLSNLGNMLMNLNRLGEAEPLMRRALAIRERALPPNHPDIAQGINNLASVLSRLGRLEETVTLHRRALAIYEYALPENHPDIAQSLTNLAEVLRLLNRPGEAEPLLRRALAIRERALPADHPQIAESLNVLGAVLAALQHPAEAEALQRRALAIQERGLPAGHPDIGRSLEYLATLSIGQGALEQALEFSYRLADIRVADKNRTALNWRWVGALQADAADKAWQRDGKAAEDIVIKARRAAFRNLQFERSGESVVAIAAATARAQAADPAVAPLARERDQVLAEIPGLDASFLKASSADDLDRATRAKELADLRTRSEAARERLASIDAEIAQVFPAFAELSSNQPLEVGDLMPLLADDEVLVSVTPYGTWGFFYAYSRKGGSFAWLREAGDARILAAKLRCSAAAGLDPSCLDSAGSAPGAETARSAIPARQGHVRQGNFDLDLAHDLYRRLFPENIRDFIKDKKLIIVPAPELMGLPWHLLVTEPPPKGWNDPGADRAAAYKQAKWLFQAHPSITVLPAVASLRALRGAATQRVAGSGMLGVGDPVIGRTAVERDAPAMKCGRREDQMVLASADTSALAARSAGAAPKSLFDGERDGTGFALADPELVRGQPRLADTRCELESVAGALTGERADLLFGADATETRIRELDESGALARYRILHFATHGLLGGELGPGEPGLVLTPPQQASPRDDGILTASEIATLTLGADWVVLSACNTAAGGDAGAEALSGLARSFFYAGARSLLVSSWPVYSPAAVAITTATFEAMKDNPRIGRAEALTLAMRGALASASSEYTAHPAYWAPFFFVGEGAR